jgi:5-methylcytosine-specific restriction endonuclease McrA
MNHNFGKTIPIRLTGPEYAELHDGVLRRDGWRCQFCGSMSNLEVHHQQFRSHSGLDHEDNLITLCHTCHLAQHYK